jgi:hypothetical protein
MAFHLVISDTVRFPVKGELTTETGSTEKFEFDLVATRLPAAELQARLDDKELTVKALLSEIVSGWSRVLNADGSPAAFGPEALDRMWQTNGMTLVAWRAYLEHVGARAKN